MGYTAVLVLCLFHSSHGALSITIYCTAHTFFPSTDSIVKNGHLSLAVGMGR
jgi:hypothetical protein